MKKCVGRFLICLVLSVFAGGNSLLASEPAKIDSFAEAKKCSGVFFILTSIGEAEPALSEYFTNGVKISDDLITAYYGQKTGEVIPRDVMLLAKEYGVQLAARLKEKIPNLFPQVVSDCIAWTHEVALFLEQNSAAFKSNADYYNTLVNGPEFKHLRPYPFPDFKPMIPIIQVSFSEWNKIGKPSPMKLKKALETPKKESNEEVNDLEAYYLSLVETPEKEAKKLGVSIHVYKGFYDENLKSKCSVDWETYERILLSCELDQGKGQSEITMNKVTKLCIKVACEPSFVQKFKYN